MLILIGLIGNTPVEIREKLSVTSKNTSIFLKKTRNFCEGAVVISTCNRMEIYLEARNSEKNFIKEVFDAAEWKKEYMKYVFILSGPRVAKHIFEVSCGFHSRILGEDQILAQVRDALKSARNAKTVSKSLNKLFEYAISCGKEFRCNTALNKIPISIASITVKEAVKKGATSFLLVGFGKVNQLVYKYLISQQYENIFIAVSDIDNVKIRAERVSVVDIRDKARIIQKADCIISGTSSPEAVLTKADLEHYREQIIFDLAVPRDIDEKAGELPFIKIYNVDDISKMDIENRELRKAVMEENRTLISQYLEQYDRWENLQIIVPKIRNLKYQGEMVYKKRLRTFVNKSSSNKNVLAEVLLKSTSDAFINRAIEVLKEETMNGENRECIRIIEKIFLGAS